MRIKSPNLLLIYSLCIAIISLSLFGCKKSPSTSKQSSDRIAIDTMKQLIYQVSKCSKLYTSEMNVRKLVTFNDERSLKGKMAGFTIDIPFNFGARKIIVPIEVNVKTYIDLSKVTEDNIQLTPQELVFILPEPQVVITSSKIEHQGVREYISGFRGHFSDAEITRLSKQGEDSLISALNKTMILEKARNSAANVLLPILEQMSGGRRVTIDYKSGLNPQQLDGKILVQPLK